MFKNLKALRESLNMKQKDFAAVFGLPTSTYNNYETGKSDPGSNFWIAVAEKYNVSIDYLLGFTDDPQRSKFATPSKLDQKYAALDDHGRHLVDAVLEIETERIAAAPPRPAAQIVDLGTIRLYYSNPAAGIAGLTDDDYEDIPRTPDMPQEADFCLTVSGDSMEPYIRDGDMIFITEKLPVGELDVGVFTVNGGAVVKQYHRNPDGSADLLSANPEREDCNIHLSAEENSTVVCWGRVILPRKLPAPVYET